MRFSLSTLVALGALQTLGVNAQDSTACITNCVNTLQEPNAAYNCPDNTATCICASTEFAKGMAECARPCGVQDTDITGNLASGFCAGLPLVNLPAATGASSEASSAPATTSEAAASTSEAAATTTETASSSAAPTSSAVPEETTSSAAESAPASTSAEAESTTTEAASATDSASASASTSASASATDKASTTEGAAGAGATSDSSDEDDKDEESSGSGGLSKSAQIGIGVGVTAGVLVLLGIALCFLWRRRNQRNNLPRGNTAISHPMPAGGANYNSADQGSIVEKNGYDLEMMSHRYEDMLPRQKPRTMV
ncbi:hypothetical protein NCS57_00715200 [Fusarium keratoplasticum]|uniref:Uncharacterized protein n=1 Tax=Fusarium keratoplasticum TaxID=1328300 RepID=A0ACC0QXN0_9HYPO|nr:hypothetical protein NCS57_00715200 [Fusarium keratoplasticum]KAI8669018.1 hypothetical protein NCS57_00715200 [Fusarium keratoplasticum]